MIYWFDLADEQFLKVQPLAPTYGMAYWGQAMSHMRFLWGYKNSDKACKIFKRMEANHATVMKVNQFYVDAAVVSKPWFQFTKLWEIYKLIRMKFI